MITSRDVARAAGVSQATVSRTIAGSKSVKPATRTKVFDAMSRLGYIPNASARAMRTGLTRSVGVVVADLRNPFYPEILDALTANLDENGQNVVVWNADGGHDRAAIDAFRQGAVDGVVFTTVTDTSAPLRAAISKNYPVVLANRTVAGIICDQVSSDNEDGGAQVARHFIESGRANLAFIGGPAITSTSRERAQGFKNEISQLGKELADSRYRFGSYSHQFGYEAMQDLMTMKNPPDAIFCGNDLLAFGAIDYAREHSIRVPDDVWVVGYDDVGMAAWPAYDITTVRQDIYAIASESVRLLLARIADPSRPPQSVKLASELIVRSTSWHPMPQSAEPNIEPGQA